MLLNSSSSRARGQPPNRSRAASRGRGSTGRGASSSSSKFKRRNSILLGSKALVLDDNPSTSHGGSWRSPLKNDYSNFTRTGTASTTISPNPFEQERQDNAVKREQRGQNGTTVNGRGARGNSRGFSHKQVRFGDAVSGNTAPSSKSPSPVPSNPFAGVSMTPNFGAPVPASINPFAPKNTTTTAMSSTNANPFGAPSQRPVSTSVFGAPSVPSTNGTKPASSSTPSLSIFGGSSASSIWGQPSSATSRENGTSATLGAVQSSLTPPTSNPFGAPSISSSSIQLAPVSAPSTFIAPSTKPFSNGKITGSTSAPMAKGSLFSKKPPKQSGAAHQSNIAKATTSGTSLAGKIEQLLRKEGITAPDWPTATPGDPRQKAVVEAFWQTSKGYRNKVRTALIRAGYLDDPDKPKKLSEAIDFKGTCEDMCPEFEKITRIVEHDVQNAEKEPAPDGSYWPAPEKMVKALARSAAGQDAPLPMDVRSPAALRRTLDYLMNTVLGDVDSLSGVHGFLWDRTRAIRRDFVFQSSMTASELEDQVYCLERITRFHVIALHLMSRPDVSAEDFSEQQEIEQLGKALLSLIHTYEDCQVQGVGCENEDEFRAYYVLFNAHDPGILETVQDWGWKFWGSSNEIQIAIRLVEVLQNIWDTRGPLKPHAATDVAQNAFSRFFSIIEDKAISYTMACFAEIHFNTVRKAALQTIVTSYRKQRDQTKDWNLSTLNAYLRFDDELDIIPFCETYGLHFDDINGEEYLSLESEEQISDPFPLNKQRHSYGLVERKRGNRALHLVIDASFYGDEMADMEDDNELFVKETSTSSKHRSVTPIMPTSTPDQDIFRTRPSLPVTGLPPQAAPSHEGSPTPPRSLFDRIPAPPPTFGGTFFSAPGTESKKLNDQESFQPQASTFATKQSSNAAQTVFTFSSTKTESRAPQLSFNKEVYIPPSAVTTRFPQDLGNEATSTHSFEIPPVAPLLKPLFEPLPPLSLGAEPKAPVQSTFQMTPRNPLSSPSASSSSRQAGSPAVSVPAPVEVPRPPLPPSAASNNDGVQRNIGSQIKPPSPISPKERLAGITNWVALGNDGLVDQFMTFTAQNILSKAYGDFVDEKARRADHAAKELARREADQFRYRSLATKYGYLWREAAHRKWLRRRGKEARQARREMAENLRASKMALSSGIVEDFKASTTAPRRSSLERLLDATSIFNGAHDPADAIQTVAKQNHREQQHKRHKSARSTRSPTLSASSHNLEKPRTPLRRSLLSDPSYLDGKSRIHLLANYGAEDESRRRSSGVQSDYFRLKARGITTLPNGTPLASSVARDLLHHKHSLDGASQTSSRRALRLDLSTKSSTEVVWLKSPTDLANGVSHEEDARNSGPKAMALTIIGKELVQPQKRGFEEDDEELFERAKRIREQMDEGLEWYRREIERDTTTRSVS